MSGDLDDLMSYLDGSPSPWHVVSATMARLIDAGFVAHDPRSPWTTVSDTGFVVADGALVAWNCTGAAPGSPLRIVGAHTDSPCLKIKPRPDIGQLGWQQLGVEVYGGALLNSWFDRDLGVAGRVVVRDADRHRSIDIAVRDAVCRIPQLAIHLDRDVNERGLQIDKHAHLSPVWGTGQAQAGTFAAWLADRVGCSPTDVLSWDLNLFDTQPAVVLGHDRSLLAAGRLDNQLSCWSATLALCGSLGAPSTPAIRMIALFDHEEVGSESTTGAAGPLLTNVIERIAVAHGVSRDQQIAQLANSLCVSADNAHAVHPNYTDRHDPEHRPIVNRGPAIKINSNQRYASSADSVATMRQIFERAGVAHQTFVSRNNMPCGSTIGPITATRLGIATVDVGIPQLSMHSARELCGTADAVALAVALGSWFGE